MKYIAVLFFLALALGQNTDASIIRFCLLQDPETNVKVIALGDLHVESESEKEHRRAVLEFLASNENWHLAAEDGFTISELNSDSGLQEHIEEISSSMSTGFLLGIIQEARKNNIDAYSVEIRKEQSCDVENYPNRAESILKLIERVRAGSVPSQFKHALHNLHTRALGLKGFGMFCAKLNWHDDWQYLTAFNELARDTDDHLMNYFTLMHILEKVSKKNVLVCMGDDHIVFLRKHLKKSGFEEIEHVVSYNMSDSLTNYEKGEPLVKNINTVDVCRLLQKVKTN